MDVLAAFCVGHANDLTAEPAKEVYSLLAIVQPVVVLACDRAVEDRIAPNKVQFVVLDVQLPLRLIPSQHTLIVSTKKRFRHCTKNLLPLRSVGDNGERA